jgi:hypothetical protein
MFLQETYRVVRRVAEIVADDKTASDRDEILWRTWDALQGLSSDQLPEDLRPKFNYQKHELSLRKGQEMIMREVNFLLAKILELELQWAESGEFSTTQCE